MHYQRIRDLREDNDLTQRELANKLGVKRSTYAMWELGDTNFPIEKLAIQAQINKTKIQYLIALSNHKRPNTKQKQIHKNFDK